MSALDSDANICYQVVVDPCYRTLSSLRAGRGVLGKLIAYRIYSRAGHKIIAGQSRRQWMDETRHRHAYRCLPLTIANSMGWEITCSPPP